MAQLDAEQVREMLKANSAYEHISSFYALRTLSLGATYPEGYTTDPRWCDAIVPTAEGTALLSSVSTPQLPAAELSLALFGLFWFEDPLVDLQKSDLGLIRTLVESESTTNRIRWPLCQGRILYDRYTNQFEEGHDTLTSANVTKLLETTTQGIYQSNNIICGPLGLIDSEVSRTFRPQQSFGLWHCPLIDCRSLHATQFQNPQIALLEARKHLLRAAVNMWDTPSRWEVALEVWPYDLGQSWRARSEMPLFLGDCIVAQDRIALLVSALQGRLSDKLRAILRLKRPRILAGEARAIAAQLSTEEQLQLLLILPDNELMTLLDSLVLNRIIDIPTTEIRQVDPAKRGHVAELELSPKLQLSDLGIRTLRAHPVLRLRRMVLDAYANQGDSNDLDWNLRKQSGTQTDDTLMEYLRKASPLKAIESLILTNRRVTKYVSDKLETTVDLPTDKTSRLLAWKLGFNLPREYRRLATLSRLITEFADTVTRIGPASSDRDREAIRSAGVNAFVELEGFIEELVAYLTWTLSSDHPKETLFTYSRSLAMAKVPSILGSEIESGEIKIRWIVTGNPLGTCVRYLQKLTEWAISLPSLNRTEFSRPTDEAVQTQPDTTTTFPFRHMQLWADASVDALDRFTSQLSECVDQINKAEVTSIRNGLEHYREERRFPSSEKILASIVQIKKFVGNISLHRLCPQPYWFSSSRTDAFTQTTIELINSDGSILEIYWPPTITGHLPATIANGGSPVLVAPGNLLGAPNGELFFRIREDSNYSEYWKHYPILKPAEDVTLPGQGSTKASATKTIPTEDAVSAQI